MFKKYFDWIKSIFNEINGYNKLSNEIRDKASCAYWAEMIKQGYSIYPHFHIITKFKLAMRKFLKVISIVAVTWLGYSMYYNK